MDATGIIIMLLCFVGPLVPPIVGTVVGTVYDAVTARRLRERRAAVAPVVVPSSAAG